MRSPLTKFVASAGVLSLSLLPEVASWDLAILSESLSLALGILTLGLFLIWLRSRSRIALISLAPVGCWWTFTRPEIRLFAVALILALLLVLWRRRDGSQKTAAGLVCLFLVAGVVWCTAAAGRVNEVHREYSAAGLSYEDELLVYRLRLHVFADPAIKAVFEERLHMPLCPGAAQVATRSTWDTEDFAREFENCPELAKWGRLNAGRLWPRFLSASPGLYLKLLWQLMNESVAGAHYAQIPAVLPAAAERVWFPSRRVGLPILLTGIVAALLAVWFTRAYRSHRPLVMFGLGLAAIAALDGFVVVSWGAGEYSRFGLLAGIGLRLAWGILLVAALDAAWRSREPGKTPLTISER